MYCAILHFTIRLVISLLAIKVVGLHATSTVELSIAVDYPWFSRALNTSEDVHMVKERLQAAEMPFNLLVKIQDMTSVVFSMQESLVFGSSGSISQEVKAELDDTRWCYFSGNGKGHTDTTALLSLCMHVNLTMKLNDEYIRITSQPFGNELNYSIEGLEHLPPSHGENRECRQKRSADDIRVFHNKTNSVLPESSSPPAKYIELYAVMDYSMYVRFNRSLRDCVTHLVAVIQLANFYYQQLDLFVNIAGLEVWKEKALEPINYSQLKFNDYAINSTALLYNFCGYRSINLTYQHLNDVAALFTVRIFDDNRVGLSFADKICTSEKSCLIVNDFSVPASAARTVVHELGHLLGLHHIDDDEYERGCNCSTNNQTNCLISSIENPDAAKFIWANCTIETFNLIRTNSKEWACLTNIPSPEYEFAACGNYIIERGEECDCGPRGRCENKCCNSETCKLDMGGSCATGQCCNLETCQLHSAGHECRPVVHPSCDEPEKCTGTSEWCPEDTYKHDGTPCHNYHSAYCYRGVCRSHTSQCKVLFGSNAEMATMQCYDENTNGKGSRRGNCGSSIEIEPTLGLLVPEYRVCTENNKLCGLLHCQGINGSIQLPRSTTTTSYTQYVSSVGSTCSSATFNLGPNDKDPGQVPDGAKCGVNHICVRSQCTSVYLPDTCIECVGENCFCNRLGTCICNVPSTTSTSILTTKFRDVTWSTKATPILPINRSTSSITQEYSTTLTMIGKITTVSLPTDPPEKYSITAVYTVVTLVILGFVIAIVVVAFIKYKKGQQRIHPGGDVSASFVNKNDPQVSFNYQKLQI